MNISVSVDKVIKTAHNVASSSGRPMPTMPIHLLYGLCVVSGCVASKYLKTVGINEDTITKVRLVHRPDMTLPACLYEADVVSKEFGQNAVVSEALLFVLCTECLQTAEVIEAFGEGTAKKLVEIILKDQNIDPKFLTRTGKPKQSLEQEILQFIDQYSDYDFFESDVTRDMAKQLEKDGAKSDVAKFEEFLKSNNISKPEHPAEAGAPKSKLPSDLLMMGADLTHKARMGKIDNIIGREEEINRIIEILCRKTKNNPVLIGEAGVGKSAIVEGLALLIIQDKVPELLKNKTIFSLDIGSLMAGTKYRGELEQRLEGLIRFVTTNNDIILFIDELHQITTATGKEGEIGISEMLKPRLARGELQSIGATTTEEYRRFIEKDSALERRFQPIIVNPPSTTQTIEILRGLKDSYEKFHGVSIGDDAIISSVTLSDRYITERNLPDKAIDVLDEACSKAKVHKTDDSVVHITYENIAEAVSRTTGVPVAKMSASDRENLANLENDMKKSIIGQDKALTFIAKAIRRSRAGVGDANRPVGSFMFLGRTGVGKTEVCKVLSKILFSNDKALIKLDMSEFTESHSVSKLIGSPPGYIGYDDGAVLCDRVRRCPYCIVLFDEIEKAHQEVYNVMLQILDEGRLTDNRGKTTSFRNALIIMTSNVGIDNITKTAQIGFSTADAAGGEEEQVMAGLKKRFRPEFINRIDNVVVFNSLTKDDITKIAGLQIDELKKKMERLGITLKINKEVVAKIVDKGYNKEYGARPIKRLVQTELEDPIAEELMTKQEVKNCNVILVDGAIKLCFN
jgi:ATP-dependent Clp protease ATP-binding subunit ClpC